MKLILIALITSICLAAETPELKPVPVAAPGTVETLKAEVSLLKAQVYEWEVLFKLFQERVCFDATLLKAKVATMLAAEELKAAKEKK